MNSRLHRTKVKKQEKSVRKHVSQTERPNSQTVSLTTKQSVWTSSQFRKRLSTSNLIHDMPDNGGWSRRCSEFKELMNLVNLQTFLSAVLLLWIAGSFWLLLSVLQISLWWGCTNNSSFNLHTCLIPSFTFLIFPTQTLIQLCWLRLSDAPSFCLNTTYKEEWSQNKGAIFPPWPGCGKGDSDWSVLQSADTQLVKIFT